MFSTDVSDIREAIVRADPRLSRFDPLPRILCLDDFDKGHSGWSQLLGNYEGSLKTILPGYRNMTNPMLSTLSHWDSGSHGAMDGTYALKVSTRPSKDAVSVAIKRLTFRRACRVRLEFYATFKPEAVDLALSDRDLKSIGFLLDLQPGDREGAGAQRVMPHLRYLNAKDGKLEQKWQFKRQSPAVKEIGSRNETVSHFHLADEGWEDLAGGAQRLCYNEIATKVNWHYFRFDFDLESMSALWFQCNDRVFDMSGFDSIRLPAMKNLWCMLNVCLFAETAADKRAFLYVDSVCLSGNL